MIKTIILIILTLISGYLFGWSMEKDNAPLAITAILSFIIFGFWLLGTALNGGL